MPATKTPKKTTARKPKAAKAQSMELVLIPRDEVMPAKRKASATFEMFRDPWHATWPTDDGRGHEPNLKKYKKGSPWVYIAIRAISDACGQIPFRVRDVPSGRVVDGYDLGLVRLLRQPNDFQFWFDFVEEIWISMGLTGNCFIELVRDGGGRVVEMYVLNPARVAVIPDPKTKVAGYLYIVNGKQIIFPADSIIHMKYADLANDFYGLAPLEVAKDACESDKLAAKWNKNFLQRGSWPAGAIEMENDIDATELKRMRRMIKEVMQQGADQAGMLMLLTGGAKYNAFAVKPKESDWSDTRRMSRDEVLAIFGVPYAVAGLWSTEQTTARSAGVEQQIKQFYRNTIFPKVRKFVDILNLRLIPLFRQRYEIYPDYGAVPALQDEVEQELTRAMALATLVRAGLSLNKAMKRLYPEMASEPWGDVAWLNQAMVPIKGPENEYAQRAETPLAPPDPDADPNESPEERQARQVLYDHLGPDFKDIVSRVRLARNDG